MHGTNQIWNQVLDQQKIIEARVAESRNIENQPVDAVSENGSEAVAEVVPSNLTTPTGQQHSVTPGPPPDENQSSVLEPAKASAALEVRKRKRKVCRTDSGKLHRVRHGILAREALDALVQVGEDRKTLRRLERQYRAALRPIGPFGNLFFDRFWASYLRLLLIGRLETRLIARNSLGKSKSESLALVPGQQPTLVRQDPDGQPSGATPMMHELPPDLLRDLVLVQRYDRHHSRELYRTLGLLLLLRRGGEPALEDWASEMLGSGKTHKED